MKTLASMASSSSQCFLFASLHTSKHDVTKVIFRSCDVSNTFNGLGAAGPVADSVMSAGRLRASPTVAPAP